MAMLAEPRRRQRICANPRGKFFMEDESNKGRTLLHKMGWKEGEGLGHQSQGMSEPIKPKVQSNSNGLGFDVKENPWVEHNKRFDQILEQLNSNNTGSEDNSQDVEERRLELEKRSKSSRARIHYTKFVKNKDLSSISNQDWSCIFGKKVNNLGELNQQVVNSNKLVGTKKEQADKLVQNSDDSFNTVNRGSMADYFKQKQRLSKSKITTESEISISENSPNDESGMILQYENKTSDFVKSKKKKRRKKLDVDVEDAVDAPDVASQLDEIKKKKKSKRKLAEESTAINEDVGTESSTNGFLSEDKNDIAEYENENLNAAKPKKKKHRTKQSIEDFSSLPDSTENLSLIPSLPDKTKSKKKKKKLVDEANEAVLEDNESTINKEEIKLSKKKKRKLAEFEDE